MKKILTQFREELIKYCKVNRLSYEKILQSPMCGNNKILFIQHRSQIDSGKGLLDNTPAEVLLQIERDNEKIVFTPGKNMYKYLA